MLNQLAYLKINLYICTKHYQLKRIKLWQITFKKLKTTY